MPSARQAQDFVDLPADRTAPLMADAPDRGRAEDLVDEVENAAVHPGLKLEAVGRVQDQLPRLGGRTRRTLASMENVDPKKLGIMAALLARDDNGGMLVPVLRMDPHTNDVPLMHGAQDSADCMEIAFG